MTSDNDNTPRRPLPLGPTKPEAEVEDELRFHLEQRVQAYIDAGMSPDDARRAAHERFGDVEGVRVECTQLLVQDRKAAARRDWYDDLRQDIRFALRSAVRAPLFSLLAVITLALGIGANAAVFGVVKSVLLDALPYHDSGRLLRIYAPLHNGTSPHGTLSAGTSLDIRERQHSFSSFGAFTSPRDVIFDAGDRPQVVHAMWIEPSLLPTLGVAPIRGAGFRPEDAQHDTALVTILPFATWQRYFNGDAGIVGRTIRLNGIPRTVVGVLPRDFVPPENDADFYLPLGVELYMRDPIGARGSHNFGMIGRLKPGVDPSAAHRELVTIGDELEKTYAKDNLGMGLSAVPLRDAMVGDTRAPLIVLLASAALVLLIMCANLAGALLSRTISRRREFAVRVALGAGRGRLMRQLLTESVLLALVGGAAGLALAMGGLATLRSLALPALPSYASLSLDSGAIVITTAVALLTGLAFGIGPALAVGRQDPQGTLREQTRGTSESRRTRRLRGLLVAGQIALCISLLSGAGLLARSLWQITTAPAGFNPTGLLTFTVQLPGARYRTDLARTQFYDAFLEKLRALPGVTGAASTMQLPTRIGNSNGLFIETAPWGPNEPVPFILTARVSDDYFNVLGVPLRQGRAFNRNDLLDAPPVMIINEAMARKYWPSGGAVGARVHIGPPNPDAPKITIVGIVGNVRNDPTRLLPQPTMYLSTRQSPAGDTYIVRTTGDPLALTTSVRNTLASLDATLPMYRVETMDDVLSGAFAARRLPVILMTAFGVLALLLASVGVYAMFASMAAAREREFGVRIALGSTRSAIAALVLRQGGSWMLLGLLVGGIGVTFAGRLLRSQLYGIAATDPLAIGLALLVLLLCAGAALLVPVRRASRVDPITVLR